MVQGARWLYLALVAVFLAGVGYQAYLAGMGLFGETRDFTAHVNLGWILHLSPILLLIVGAVARIGARLLWWNAALVVSVFVQPLLPGFRADAPWLAAFHPVNALVIFWLTISLGLRTWAMVRQSAAA